MAEGRPFSLDQVRANLEKLYGGLNEMYQTIVDDQQKLKVCRAYSEYQASMPKSFLDKARARLDRKTYKVGFAGAFSSGKSTLINSLFGAPDMLPTEAGECTMSITLVGPPPPGQEEHVEAKYFTREEAVRFVLTNERYRQLFAPIKDKLLADFDVEKGLAGIREVIGKMTDVRQKTMVGMAEPKRELTEFLEMLEKHRTRLGTVHIDRIENAPTYLTTDKSNRGLGHLLMIEQVHLYRNNPLFNEVGTEIVDTPGTDSTNERQRELTYRYLAESDAIMLVLEPRGISMAGRNIWEELGKYNRSIRNKMFFLMNKFDTLGTQDLKKDQLEKLLVSQVIEKLTMYNLDPGKLFLTCAKVVDLENRKMQRKISEQEIVELGAMYKDFEAKRSAVDPGVKANLKPLINQALTDGALADLRKKLVDYLRWDIQVERLGEVYADLSPVLEATGKLMASEEPVLADLRKKMKTQSEEVVEFFEGVKNAFFDSLSVIPKGVEAAVKIGVGRAKSELQTRITAAIERFNFQRIIMRMAVVNPQDVKMQVISQFKTELSARFADVVKGAVSPLIVGKLQEQVKASRVDQVVNTIAKELKTDHGQRFDELVKLFCSNMEQFTYLRALESTWKLQDADMRPAGFEPTWTDQVEKEFREDLKSVFVGPLVDEAGALEPILARHYRALVMDMLDRFEKLIDELWTDVKKDPDRVKLPVALLSGEQQASEDELIRAALVRYDAMLKALQDLEAKIPKDVKSVVQK